MSWSLGRQYAALCCFSHFFMNSFTSEEDMNMNTTDADSARHENFLIQDLEMNFHLLLNCLSSMDQA